MKKRKQHLIFTLFIILYLLVFIIPVVFVTLNYGKSNIATPVITKVESQSYNSIRLAWTECAGVDGYILYRYDDKSKEFNEIAVFDDSEEIEYTDIDLNHDTGYAYKIEAYKEGILTVKRSGLSEMKSTTTVLDPSELISVKNTGNSNIVVYWSKVENIEGYELYRSTDAYSGYKKIYESDDSDTVHYTDRSLKKNKTYHYKIRTYSHADNEKIVSDLSGFESEKSIGDDAEVLEAKLKESIEAPDKSDSIVIAGMKIDGYKVTDSFVVKSYAYSGGGITATGQKCQVGRIAVDPSVIPLGTWLYVEGYGLCQASDTGGDIIGKTIDVYKNTELECKEWGIKYPMIYILEKL